MVHLGVGNKLFCAKNPYLANFKARYLVVYLGVGNKIRGGKASIRGYLHSRGYYEENSPLCFLVWAS